MDQIKTYNNRGMLLEKIINNTINHYSKNRIAFFNKKTLNIKFKAVKHQNAQAQIDAGYIASKSTVDYYGLYQGHYISFEAKSTELDHLPWSNIQLHQHQHLKLIKEFGGWAFYLLLFKKYNRIFLIDVDLFDLQDNNKKSISLKEIENNALELELIFPGIIDFLAYFPYR